MTSSPFSLSVMKNLSHTCGESPLLQVYLLVRDGTMKSTHTFPTVFSPHPVV